MKLPSLIKMMQQLIAAPSVSSVNPQWDQSNRQVVEMLDQWCGTLGFRTEVLPVPGHANKFNLIATLGEGPEGLVLSGHTDTVPFDEALWQTSPFELEERGGRLYGLGTSDMKGFFAVALTAVARMALSPHSLRQPLVLLATADEESTMCGARALVDYGRRLGRHALIGEPTGLRPVRMHKGIAMESIRLTGRSGHSSDPRLGNNALEGMQALMGELLAWRSAWQDRHHNPLFEVDTPTLNLGHIHGGDNPNRICGECELQFDLRPLPGMALKELRAELDARLRPLAEGRGLKYKRSSLFPGIPAMETPAEAAIVKSVETLTQHPAEAVAFGTEGPYLNELGMQTVVLGPGDIEQAHQPDEYLALERIDPMIDLLNRLIQEHCL